MSRRSTLRSPFFWAVLALAVIVAIMVWPNGDSSETPETIKLTEFDDLLAGDEIARLEIIEGPNIIEGATTSGTEFQVRFLRENGDEIVERILEADPEIPLEVTRAPGGSLWLQVIFSLLPILLLGLIFVVALRMFSGGRSSFSKTSARKLDKDLPDVTFDDVAGSDEAVEELREIKDFLCDPARYFAMGAKIPKGVLLYGPPGTGKTLLAKAVAGEAGVPFFSISGSDFVEMFVGVGASRVRDLFKQAKEEAPAIVFIDEIDAVGRHRGAGLGGGHDEREQTLNQLLVEMDGFEATSGVIMIAATNRPDILDPALLRPGRFDRQITVDRPDLEGRRGILKVHMAGKPFTADVDPDTVARRTPGFTGADLGNLMNESALLAARRRQATIDFEIVEEAIDRVMAGPQRKSRVLSDHERKVIAYHEAGHALVGHVLQNTDPIHKVSIISRGRALGWTLALPEHDRYLRSRSQLHDELAMLLGGRSAEEMIFGDPTTGAADDIERVSKLARAMVTQYGMSDALGPKTLGQAEGEVFLGKNQGREADYSDDMARRIDAEIDRLVTLAHTEAREVLTTHRVTLVALAEALLESETLDKQQLDELFASIETTTAPDVIDLTSTPAHDYGDAIGRATVGSSGVCATPEQRDSVVRPPQNHLPSEPPTNDARGPKH
jgi:cell division protease FtsH